METCKGYLDEGIWQTKDIRKWILRANRTGRKLNGAVYAVRDFGEFLFIILRTPRGNIQAVVNRQLLRDQNICVRENCFVKISGELRDDARAPNGFEIVVRDIDVLSSPSECTQITLNKKRMNISLEQALNHRPITLRHPDAMAVFKIQEGICRGFRDFLCKEGFTEIHTPKIVFAGAEGGSNIFRMEYFEKKAYLTQSPQFYKQTMVGVYDRVFEIGPVFRAEKHNSARHLNEYTSLDFEMGYIEHFSDIMNMETAMLRYTMTLIKEEYPLEVERLGIQIPDIGDIPCVRFDEGKEMVKQYFGRPFKDPYDLQPEEEQLLGELISKEYGSDFVFVTHYPSKKRPFYAMDDPSDPKVTYSFDLLFRGMEVTTGGQRIHDYEKQKKKMTDRGLDPADFESYLMIHRYGMPPHGGLGLGLERLTMKLAGLSNIRLAALFPRDRTRITP